MLAHLRTAIVDPDPKVRTGRDVGRPSRPHGPRRRRRRGPSRRTRDRVRSAPLAQPSAASGVGSGPDRGGLPFAAVLDLDFDQEDDALALGPPWRLAHAVRAEEDDALGF